MSNSVIRNYSLQGGVFRCVSDVSFPISPDCEGIPFLADTERIILKEYISKGKLGDQYVFHVVANSSCPPSVIHDEIRYFLQTLKQMYEL